MAWLCEEWGMLAGLMLGAQDGCTEDLQHPLRETRYKRFWSAFNIFSPDVNEPKWDDLKAREVRSSHLLLAWGAPGTWLWKSGVHGVAKQAVHLLSGLAGFLFWPHFIDEHGTDWGSQSYNGFKMKICTETIHITFWDRREGEGELCFGMENTIRHL
jgi:hypothetical protein